jgi:hypothetical protein
MKKDFQQSYISPALTDFKDGFNKKWGLSNYHDINAPLVFFGMYGQQDVDVFLNHKGPKLVIWGGNDMHPGQLNLVKSYVDKGTTYTFAPPGEFSNTLNKYKIKHKVCYIPNKDYSMFTPTPLGENIYIYMGRPDNPRLEYFKYNEIVSPLVQVFGEDRVKWVTQNESSTLPMDKLIEKYYNDCFVFVKPHERGGATSMYDLAHMGRKTIGKGEVNLPNFIEYSDLNNLIELVVEEAKYIGKVREDVANGLKNHFLGDEWLDLNFWND